MPNPIDEQGAARPRRRNIPFGDWNSAHTAAGSPIWARAQSGAPLKLGRKDREHRQGGDGPSQSMPEHTMTDSPGGPTAVALVEPEQSPREDADAGASLVSHRTNDSEPFGALWSGRDS